MTTLEQSKLLDELRALTEDTLRAADSYNEKNRALLPEINTLDDQAQPCRRILPIFSDMLRGYAECDSDRKRGFEAHGVTIGGVEDFVEQLGNFTSEGFIIDGRLEKIALEFYSPLAGQWAYKDFVKRLEKTVKRIEEQIRVFEEKKAPLLRRSQDLSKMREGLLMDLSRLKWRINKILEDIPPMPHGYSEPDFE